MSATGHATTTSGERPGRSWTRLAIDVGGTFTDVVFRDATGAVNATKVATTPEDVTRGVLHGIEKVNARVEDLGAFIHGTTIALNALLQGRTPAVALITTRGFRDVLEIMRTNRPNMYDLQQDKPTPLVPRRLRTEIGARMAASGASLAPVDADEVADLARRFEEEGIESIAVCLLNSYANPEHEREVEALLHRFLPHASISVSTDLTGEWREFERTSTAVINAATKPIISGYLARLEDELSRRGFAAPLLLMRSNGGVMSAREARHRPVAMLMSGPVGGVAAAVDTAGAGNGIPGSLVTLDIGGTSADVAIVDAAEPVYRSVGRIGEWPILGSMVDIRSIGAGGGSYATVDAFGALTVGPDSAGAYPGPACYGRGGTRPTVTDAHVVLGRINPDYFLGGEFPLDAAIAREAVEDGVARRYGMTPEEAAHGIIEVINARMARLLWEVMIGAGYDPRDFALLAFGGAGPLHACELAQVLGIREVLVPPSPGSFSAYGMLAADVRHEFERMVVGRAVTSPELHELFVELEADARSQLEQEGVEYERIDVIRSVELRYAGQRAALMLQVDEPIGRADLLDRTHAAFQERHQRLYGFVRDATPIEMLRVQLAAIGRVGVVARQEPRAVVDDERPVVTRPLVVGRTVQAARIVRRARLRQGSELAGPAVVEEPTSATYVPPGCVLRVDRRGVLRITVPAAGGIAQ